MRRQRINLNQIAMRDTLLRAAHRAARGKRQRADVQLFFRELDQSINLLAARVRRCDVPVGAYHTFHIRDPKVRIIHAPTFHDRVIHHAIVSHIGDRLDRSLVDSSYACREGKGALAAIHRVQAALRRYPWYVKIDISGYFDHINHGTLKQLLRLRFKGEDGLRLIDNIIDSYHVQPGCGLPIGTLTSQHFANYYLDGTDRFISERLKARAHVRYMDDIVWWTDSRDVAKEQLQSVMEFLWSHRQLEVKPDSHIQRSRHGITFCGYRVHPYRLRLTVRRKRRYRQRRQHWERAFKQHQISASGLQQAYSGVHGIVCHADSKRWRRRQLEHYSAVEA